MSHAAIILCAVSIICCQLQLSNSLEVQDTNQFFYFGYGSNLLARRIHINNPTAVRVGGYGKLQDYRLDFNEYSEAWLGAPATIVPTVGAVVYGAVWQIDMSNFDDLDKQEGVDTGDYIPINVPVQISNGTTVACRLYHLTNQPTTQVSSYTANAVPSERQPSKSYLKTLVKGAIESGLPETYIDSLKSIKHNGNIVPRYEEQLQLANVQLNS